MNQEDKKHRLNILLLYLFLVLCMVGYSYVRLGELNIYPLNQLFGYAGRAGYILAAGYLLLKTWNKAGWEEIGTIGLALSITYTITLLVPLSFLSGPIPGQYPLLVGVESVLCFFTAAAWVALLIRFIDHMVQVKAPQWQPNVRPWETFLMLYSSLLFIFWTRMDNWKTWFENRQNPDFTSFSLFPPMELVTGIIVAVTLLIFFITRHTREIQVFILGTRLFFPTRFLKIFLKLKEVLGSGCGRTYFCVPRV